MAIRLAYFHLLFLVLISHGCTSVQHISKTNIRYEIIKSDSTLTPDAEITHLIAPYKVKVDEQMNEVLANVSEELTKKKPESTLGNWYSDAMMSGAKKEGYHVDFAISNYGGLRVPQITTGPLTRGEIYELCPFDNLMMIVDVPGTILDSVFQQIASSEGWPVSDGVRMVIHEKKMIRCLINGNPIHPTDTYKVAMPDYVANGGDDLKILIPLTRIQTGKLIRDMLIEYALETAGAGKEITASIQGRIVIE